MKPHNLTEGSISQRLLLFTLPILIGNILQSLNATVNSFWIGHFLGEAALTASSNNAAAAKFLDFFKSATARSYFEAQGFTVLQ